MCPFDLIGYAEATPGTGEVLIAAALADSLYKHVLDDNMIIKGREWLLGAYFAALTTGESGFISQPSLHLDYQFLSVQGMGAAVAAMAGYTHMFGRPLRMVGGEKCNVKIQNASDEDALVGLLLGSGKISQSKLDAVNPTHRIRGSADQTLTARAWTNVAITWDQDLPEGEYAVVGMKYGYYKGTIAMPAMARILLPGKTSWRPGVPGNWLGGDKLQFETLAYHKFEHWPLMREISFLHSNMPDIEALSPEATTDHVVELLLQKIG